MSDQEKSGLTEKFDSYATPVTNFMATVIGPLAAPFRAVDIAVGVVNDVKNRLKSGPKKP
jgi:hypothetical protein